MGWLFLFHDQNILRMAQLLYYLVIFPLSRLPMSWLYGVSNVLYRILYKWVGYRKKVVWNNLIQSFPEKEEKELLQIMNKFYRHFFDLIAESLKMFSMSAEEAVAGCTVVNRELLDAYTRQGRDIIITAGHYNNWEFAALSLGLQIDGVPAGIYHPLKNKFFEQKIKASRGKYGMILVPKQDTKSFLSSEEGRPLALLMGTDQSPHDPRKAFWTTFLGRETAVMFGTEKIAKEYNHVVVFGHIRKISRGKYEMWFELITENPRETPYGEITLRHTQILEKDILQQPEYWLWTHKRWKRQRPEDMQLVNE